MKRYRLLLIALPLWLAAPAAPASEPLAGSTPNIILMITDDQGYGPIGRHGHPWIQTPHLDQLYDQSVRDASLLEQQFSQRRQILYLLQLLVGDFLGFNGDPVRLAVADRANLGVENAAVRRFGRTRAAGSWFGRTARKHQQYHAPQTQCERRRRHK